MTVKEKPYWSRKPRGTTVKRLKKIKRIVGDSEKTVRNITYKLYPDQHGKDLTRKYNTTIKDVVRARVHGILDWGQIREQRVNSGKAGGYEDLDEYLDSKFSNIELGYSKDKTPAHKRKLEVWFEKQTVIREFRAVCSKYDVRYVSGRGQITWTAKKKASDRLGADDLILYFGDNDSKGREIADVIKRDLTFLDCNAQVKWAGITREQEQKYGLPDGSRIDGLDLADLKDLIESQVQQYIDMEKFKEIKKEEEREKNKLKDMEINIEQ